MFKILCQLWCTVACVGVENWFYCCCLGPLLEALVLEIKLNIDVWVLPFEGIELGLGLFLEASAVLGGSGGILAFGSSFSLSLSWIGFDFALSLGVFSFVMPPVWRLSTLLGVFTLDLLSSYSTFLATWFFPGYDLWTTFCLFLVWELLTYIS